MRASRDSNSCSSPSPRIPTPLWVVIYVGVFLLALLIGLHYTDDPRGRVTALASTTVLLTVVITVLAVLDRPFGVGARWCSPSEMHQADRPRVGGHQGLDPGAVSRHAPEVARLATSRVPSGMNAGLVARPFTVRAHSDRLPEPVTTVREAAFDLFRARGMTTMFGNPGSTELPMLARLPG